MQRYFVQEANRISHAIDEALLLAQWLVKALAQVLQQVLAASLGLGK